MIAVTGAAGFIGSNIVHALNRAGREDIIVCDVHANDEANANLAPLRYERYLSKDNFRTWLNDRGNARRLEALYHMGACSSTTETDWGYLAENNLGYSRDLCLAALDGGARFINASSAATYGDGELGYDDDQDPLDDLKPLNLYARSKQEFDLWARDEGLLDRIPEVAGRLLADKAILDENPVVRKGRLVEDVPEAIIHRVSDFLRRHPIE